MRKAASFKEATLNSTTFSEPSIRDIIGKSSKGKSILRYYDDKKKFEDGHRNIICAFICDEMENLGIM